MRGRRNLDAGIELIPDAGERRGAARTAWKVILYGMLFAAALTAGTLLVP